MGKAENGKYCFTIFLTEPNGGGVIGANLMQDNDVVFDLDKKTVGFAAANCGK